MGLKERSCSPSRALVATLAFVLLACSFAQDPTPVKKTKTPVKSKEIEFAPEADLENGVDDFDEDNEKCATEIKNYCKDIEVGEGRLSDCLSEQITQSEAGGDESDSVSVSEDCKEAVFQFKIRRDSNINANLPLAKACKSDAEKYCNATWYFGNEAGHIIACLRDIRDKLKPVCKKEVFKVQLDGAIDFRADPLLYESCKKDAETLCKGVKFGGGRVQACLRDKRMQLSWLCEEQLFRQEMENADDVRLTVRLFSKCINDKRKFCQDIPPGGAAVKECLEEHRNDDGFSESCKEEVDAMVERRVRDFRLDSKLRAACEADIYSMCAFFGDLDTIDSYDGSVIRCLQDYVSEIKNEACKAQVLKYQQLASEDFRFDVPLADACYEDRQKLCGHIPPGSARVIRCLTINRKDLSANCGAVLFDEEVRFSENIDFQYPMKKACAREIQTYCKNIPHGHARVIRCLQDNKNKKDFGKDCRAEIKSYEQEASQDYRLNYRLSASCAKDVSELCKNACKAEEGQVCGGSILRCLTERKDEIKSEACQNEVFYFEKMEVMDFRNDVILAAACKADVEKFCQDIEPGEGRVHECLRKNRKALTEQCRKEELLLEQQEAENVELRPGLLKACVDERQMFCKDVQPGQARVFRCLAEKMGDLDFGDQCRVEISNKLIRRQANWKLDPPLRKACRTDVQENCAVEDKQDSETGAVYQCLIKKYNDLDAGCQKELGRAVHMAFFVWAPGSVITQDCDDDIRLSCLGARPNMGKTPGAVGSCLASILEEQYGGGVKDASGTIKPPRTLSEKCRALADVAEPPNMKQAFEASLSVALLQSQLSRLEGATGLNMLNRDQTGVAESITLTGWTALAGITAMVVLIMWGLAYGYKRYKGIPDKDYTVVLKGKGKH